MTAMDGSTTVFGRFHGTLVYTNPAQSGEKTRFLNKFPLIGSAIADAEWMEENGVICTDTTHTAYETGVETPEGSGVYVLPSGVFESDLRARVKKFIRDDTWS
jgi:hypothetical protein